MLPYTIKRDDILYQRDTSTLKIYQNHHSIQLSKMVSISKKVLASIAFLLFSSAVNSAPIDGVTKRAPGVIGLDFEVHVLQNGTLVKRGEPEGNALVYETQFYLTYLNFGSDSQRIGVDIDTGSSDLWVPTSSTSSTLQQYGTYNPSSSSSENDLGIPFSIKYVDQSSSTGEFVTDTVSLDNGVAKLNNFQFAKVDSSSVGNSGIFGIGPPTLESSLVQGGSAPEYPNFPIALKNAGYINRAAYSIYLDSVSSSSGSILFGGKDLSKIDGPLVTLPHAGDPRRLGATLNSLSFGGQTVDVSTAYTFDTGSTISSLSSDAFSGIVSALGGDTSNTILNFPVVDCSTSGSLSFDFEGISIDIPISEFIVNAGLVCVFRVTSASPGNEILGDDFLRHAYLVYDVENPSVSLAKVNYDDSTKNIVPL